MAPWASLVGDSLQTPPAYSAVKVGGRKLYEAARKGEVLEAAPRPIRVDAFALTGYRAPDVDFLVTCSGGTYVRVLLADVGSMLGCGAHLIRLRRTAIGTIDVADAIAPEEVVPLPMDRAVAHLPRLDLERGRGDRRGSRSHPRPGRDRGAVRGVRARRNLHRRLRGRRHEGSPAGDPRRAGLTCVRPSVG